MGTFLHRATGILRDRLANVAEEHEAWDIKATQLRFNWGGHVARLLHLDPNRLTYRVFKHWSYEGLPRASKHTTVGDNATADIFTFGDGSITCTNTSELTGHRWFSTWTLGA